MEKQYCKKCGRFIGKTYKSGKLEFEGFWELGKEPVCKDYPNCFDIKTNTVNIKDTKDNLARAQT